MYGTASPRGYRSSPVGTPYERTAETPSTKFLRAGGSDMVRDLPSPGSRRLLESLVALDEDTMFANPRLSRPASTRRQYHGDLPSPGASYFSTNALQTFQSPSRNFGETALVNRQVANSYAHLVDKELAHTHADLVDRVLRGY
ncbi:hypothetical protein CYMTET_42032 [Cymbomonas tetramitiformis]|uniref:Uncharacterized protein n=1 Tax=Cymbomonas tetramitiformis TaxID=36881 RepID=A0AAE0C6V0_9CHLO|nr:hypothetical protein CYMTET_42032 [Cymbomonas tetramitiformis]